MGVQSSAKLSNFFVVEDGRASHATGPFRFHHPSALTQKNLSLGVTALRGNVRERLGG
jgi:hypothetical protein